MSKKAEKAAVESSASKEAKGKGSKAVKDALTAISAAESMEQLVGVTSELKDKVRTDKQVALAIVAQIEQIVGVSN